MPATDSSQIANASDSIEETSDAMSRLRMGDLPPGHHRGRTILCPVVDDDASSAAVEWALDNVWRDKQDTIHLLCILPTRYENTGYVYPMMGTPTKAYYEKLDDETEHRRRLDRAKAKHFIQARFGRKLSQLGIPYLIDLTTGSQGNIAIGELICAVAEAVKADLICMATHNRNAFTRLFVGSVANYCLRNATMPVLMLRPGERTSSKSHRRVLFDRRDSAKD